VSSVNIILICEKESFCVLQEYLISFTICQRTHFIWSDETECLLFQRIQSLFLPCLASIWLACDLLYIIWTRITWGVKLCLVFSLGWMMAKIWWIIHSDAFEKEKERVLFIFSIFLRKDCFNRVHLRMWRFWWPFNGE